MVGRIHRSNLGCCFQNGVVNCRRKTHKDYQSFVYEWLNDVKECDIKAEHGLACQHKKPDARVIFKRSKDE